jgi:hypothetical protein
MLDICIWAQIKEGKGTNFLRSKSFFHFLTIYTYISNF